MAFFIAHVAGRWTASRASSTKRASVDAQEFDDYEAAEAVARARWPDGGYFIVEADDMWGAEDAAVGDSRTLDNFAQ